MKSSILSKREAEGNVFMLNSSERQIDLALNRSVKGRGASRVTNNATDQDEPTSNEGGADWVVSGDDLASEFAGSGPTSNREASWAPSLAAIDALELDRSKGGSELLSAIPERTVQA